MEIDDPPALAKLDGSYCKRRGFHSGEWRQDAMGRQYVACEHCLAKNYKNLSYTWEYEEQSK